MDFHKNLHGPRLLGHPVYIDLYNYFKCATCQQKHTRSCTVKRVMYIFF